MSDDFSASPTFADLGEDAALARIFPRLPRAHAQRLGPGDDAAVVAAPDGSVVATTDLMVQGRDFRRDWSHASDVGWKSAAQNLADIAAMGAVPTALLVALVAPPDLPVQWAVDLADGFAQGCAGTGAGVVGGDLSSGPVIMVAVTALGDLQGRAPVLRSGSRPGDVVAVAGTLGRSAAGLDLLRRGLEQVAPELVAVHRRPRPPYRAGVVAARSGVSAMLDVSDGLVRDLGRLASASGVQIDLDSAALMAAFGAPLMRAAEAVGGADSASDQALTWVLSGGEDHALAATFAPDATIPADFRPIGTVQAAVEPDAPVLLDGALPDAHGWDHFSPH